MSIQSPAYNKYRSYDSYFQGRYSTDPYGSGESNAQYEQELLQYISQVKIQIHNLQQGTPAYHQALDYLNTAMGYLQMVDPQMEMDSTLGGNDWDPLTMGTNPYENGQEAPQFPISYQDNTKIMTDEGSSTRITLGQNDSETRILNVFQKDNTLIVPSNAANVTVTAQPDDSVTGKTEIVVTYTSNGHTRTIQYHNVERDNFKLNIQVPDKSQVGDLSGLSALQLKVNVTELGSAPEETQGTSPDKNDKYTRIWNKNDLVDYYVTEGKETDKIFADSVNITLPDRSHKAYVTKTGAHDYIIEIQDENGKAIRHIEAHQVKSLNFDPISDDNLFFQDNSSKGSPSQGMGSVTQAILPKDHFKPWSDSTHDKDPQISVGGMREPDTTSGAGLPVNPNFSEDNVPDSVKNGVATYDGSAHDQSKVSIHSLFDDPLTVKEHDIFTSGEVTIFASSYQDKVVVTKDDDGRYRVMVEKNGDPNTTVTYLVAGDASQIKMKGFLPSNIINTATIPKTELVEDPKTNGGLLFKTTYVPDPKVKVEG